MKKQMKLLPYISGYAAPDPDKDAVEVSSLREAKRVFENYIGDAERFGAGYDNDRNYGEVYIGDCDYPEWQIFVGPRGGIRSQRC